VCVLFDWFYYLHVGKNDAEQLIDIMHKIGVPNQTELEILNVKTFTETFLHQIIIENNTGTKYPTGGAPQLVPKLGEAAKASICLTSTTLADYDVLPAVLHKPLFQIFSFSNRITANALKKHLLSALNA
jgi:hypothetical protein